MTPAGITEWRAPGDNNRMTGTRDLLMERVSCAMLAKPLTITR
jgi:hypothetical protein